MSYELANVCILDILLPSSLVQYIFILFYYTCLSLKRASLVPRKHTGYPVSEQVCPAEITGNLGHLDSTTSKGNGDLASPACCQYRA